MQPPTVISRNFGLTWGLRVGLPSEGPYKISLNERFGRSCSLHNLSVSYPSIHSPGFTDADALGRERWPSPVQAGAPFATRWQWDAT